MPDLGETLRGNVYMCCMHSLQFVTFGFTFTEKGAWTSHFRLCSWTSRLLSLIWLICWMIRQSMFLRSWTQPTQLRGATQITKTAAAQTANELYLSNYQSHPITYSLPSKFWPFQGWDVQETMRSLMPAYLVIDTTCYRKVIECYRML